METLGTMKNTWLVFFAVRESPEKPARVEQMRFRTEYADLDEARRKAGFLMETYILNHARGTSVQMLALLNEDVEEILMERGAEKYHDYAD